MDVSHSRIRTSLVLMTGVLLGWVVASLRPAPARASAGDRAGECIVATGPVLIQYDDVARAPIPIDALYLLDYKGGRLLATIPTYRQTGAATHLIDTFAERDLAADFKLELDTGPRPRFLMTTGSLGTYSSGWAPLYVFETTTNQLGVYRMHVAQSAGPASRPRFELVELRSYAKAEAAEPRR
jgi:hypothetical protein